MFLDDPKISRVVFYPRKDEPSDNLGKDIKSLKFNINNEIMIGGYIFINDSNLPSVLMFHGNGEIARDYQHFYKSFLNCGINLAVMDFRGYGFSTGKPTYTSLIDDAMPIYNQFLDWLGNNDFNSSVFIFGRSLGSVCAAEIGSHNPEKVNGIIFESGFASLYDMMTRLFNVKGPNITKNTLEEFSNHTRVKKVKKPLLIIHGTNDWIIPKEQAQQIFKAAPSSIEKKKVLIEGATHNNIQSYQEEYFSNLKQFIENYK